MKKLSECKKCLGTGEADASPCTECYGKGHKIEEIEEKEFPWEAY